MLLRVAARTLRRRWLDGLVKACMHSFPRSSTKIVVLRSVCRETGGVLFVGVHYPEFRSFEVCAYGDRDFLVSGNILKICNYTRLAAVSAKSLPLMFACPLILCSIVRRPSLILY